MGRRTVRAWLTDPAYWGTLPVGCHNLPVALLATAAPHHRSLVFAIAAFVFILTAAGLVFMEIVAGLATRAENQRKAVGNPPRTGYWGLVASVMTGPAPKVFRRRAAFILAVSAVVAAVGLLV